MHIVCPSCMAVNRVPKERLEQGPKCGKCKNPLLDGSIATLTQASFGDYTSRNHLPVLVDFWAQWCGPCKSMAPIFAQAAREYSTKILFAKVDTDSEPALSSKFAIRSIPTLVLLKNGKEAERTSGAMNLQQLRQWLDHSVTAAYGRTL